MQKMLMKAVLPIMADLLQKMITEKNYRRYGYRLFELFKEFIVDTETDVDDTWILPPVLALQKAMGLADNPAD